MRKKEEGRLVPDLFLFFQKALYRVKTNGQYHTFNKFWLTST